MTERIGFIGTGTITEAIVSGLTAEPRGLREIWVSPRNQETASRLSDKYTLVRVGRDNQEVADRCTLLCLAIRPRIAEDVLSKLHLGPTHCVFSFIATWNLERLRVLMPDVADIVRLAPLPMVAQAMGPTIVFPANPVAIKLFAPLGAAIPASDEKAFDCLFASTALMGSFFATLESHAIWLQDKGIPYRDARAYLASLFSGLASTAKARFETFAELSKEFSTPGGLNEQVTADLERAGALNAQHLALDRVLDRIRNP
ncbi:pyrroline-5-carboxylate reductase [Paraburkholderia sp. BL27I4N3]|nr:pyrroline-5-carboxylate reductase [Paraburkholderia sp. BL27I4N3]